MYSRDVITSSGLRAGVPYSSIYIFIFPHLQLPGVKRRKRRSDSGPGRGGKSQEVEGVAPREYTFVSWSQQMNRVGGRRGVVGPNATLPHLETIDLFAVRFV